MTSSTKPAAVDLDDARDTIMHSMASDDRQTRAEYQAGCAALSALIAELEQLRAKAPGWKPLLGPDGLLQVDEGTTYLFAAEGSMGEWSYFSDSIGWDADEETAPAWHDGGHGWSLSDSLFFAPPPAAPEVPK